MPLLPLKGDGGKGWRRVENSLIQRSKFPQPKGWTKGIILQCKKCGDSFPKLKTIGGIPGYCSESCRKAKKLQRDQLLNPRKGKHSLFCCYCKQQFTSRYKIDFCSRRCRSWSRIALKPALLCKRCGQAIVRKFGRGRDPDNCSGQCRNERENHTRLMRLSLYPSCSISGCDNAANRRAVNLCEFHFGRLRRNGDPEKLQIMQYEVNEAAFDSWSDEIAWLLGYIWSDGNLSGNRVSITSKDLDALECAQVVLCGKDLIKERKKRGVWDLSFCSAYAAQRLRAIGLHESKSFTIGWPIGLPNEYTWSFLRGLVDGDGWVTLRMKRKNQQAPDLNLGLCGASEVLLSKVYNLILAGIGHCSFVKDEADGETRKHPFYKIQIYSHVAQRKLFQLFYPTGNEPKMMRKYLPWKIWCGTQRARVGRIARKDGGVFARREDGGGWRNTR